jgi:hypothetical protein
MTAMPDPTVLHDLERWLEAAQDKLLALAHDLDTDIDRDLDANLAFTLALALGHARGLRRCRARGLNRSLARAHGLALALNRALNWSLTLDLVRDRGLALDLARSFVRDVDGALSRVLAEVRRLQPQPASVPIPDRVARAAVRVMGWSVRVMPVAERVRYREEFMAELYELRESPRRVQVTFTARLLVYSVILRYVLRDDDIVK